MNTVSILLSDMIQLIALLATIAWFIIACPLALYRSSSIRFGLSNLFFLISFYLDVNRQSLPALNLWLLSDVLLLLALVFFNHANRYLFSDRTLPWYFRYLLFFVTALYVATLVIDLPQAPIAALLVSLAFFTMAQGAWIKFYALNREFGVAIAVTLAASDLMVSFLLCLKLVAVVFIAGFAASLYANGFQLRGIVLWSYIVFLLVINVTSIGTSVSRLVMKMKNLADHDQLTGLLNRRAITAELQGLHARFERAQTPYCVLMLDLDKFKKINDTYGHSVGDNAICHTARLLQENVRKSDYVARFGGEEFIVVLPDSTHDDGMQVAKKLVEAFRTTPWESEIPAVTVSVGCADSLMANSLDGLLTKADNALYKAKEEGRNRAVLWQASA